MPNHDLTLTLDTGVKICTDGNLCQYGDAVTVYAPDGTEVMHWNSEEWKADPEVVMGAILGCAATAHLKLKTKKAKPKAKVSLKPPAPGGGVKLDAPCLKPNFGERTYFATLPLGTLFFFGHADPESIELRWEKVSCTGYRMAVGWDGEDPPDDVAVIENQCAGSTGEDGEVTVC